MANDNWVDIKTLINKLPETILSGLNNVGLEIKYVNLKGKEKFWILKECHKNVDLFGDCISFENLAGELVEDCKIISSYNRWFVKLSDIELKAIWMYLI